MTLREKILLAIIGGLLSGLWVRDNAEAVSGVLFGVDSVSNNPAPIQTNGTNALKVLGK